VHAPRSRRQPASRVSEAVWTAGPQSVNGLDCHTFDLIDGPSVAVAAPASTSLGTATHATATLTGGHPTGAVSFQAFAAGDAACATALFTDDVTVNGAGTYASADFTAAGAGAYNWVARYGGDALHVAAASGCNDPAGEFAVVAPPSVSAAFGAAAITAGESTSLTYTITNPSANTVGLTAVGLHNTLPPGLAVASPNGLTGACGAGSIDAVPGSDSVALTGGTIPAGSSCSFAVDVTGATPGDVTTTTDAVESANGGSGNTATASLTVNAAPAPPRHHPVVTPPPHRPVVTPSPLALTARALAVSCSPDQLVLRSVRSAGRRVRFAGLAETADAGRRLIIRALPAGTVAARATVRADGSFAGSGRAPRGRAVHKARCRAELGPRRSPALKLTRRVSARLVAGAGTVTISGRVSPPLDRPLRRVEIWRLTGCGGGYAVVARVKPSARGRFRVTLPRSAGPAVYSARTRVRTKVGGRIATVSQAMLTD
jgi:hypothetical protein